jgi:hypothetical protein
MMGHENKKIPHSNHRSWGENGERLREENTELFYVFLKSLCFYPMEIGVLQLMEETT